MAERQMGGGMGERAPRASREGGADSFESRASRVSGQCVRDSSSGENRPRSGAGSERAARPRRRSRLRTVGIVVAVVAVLAVAVRIGWVNANAVTIPTEHYAMGEWVDLTGCYFNERSSENMDGYELRITEAEALSYNEFVTRYAQTEPDPADVPDDPDAKTVVVLTYEVRNADNEAGGIGLYLQHLVPARKNVDYRYDSALWWLAEPAMEGQIGGFALMPGTEYTTHVPFSYVSDPPYLQAYDHEIRMPVGEDASFELYLCNAPTRKIIDVRLAG